MDYNKLWEAAKEPLRYLVLSLIPVILLQLELIDTSWAVAFTLILRFIDKYLHLKAPDGVSGGLTRF
jgi:hypothetical protein